jgi:tetratricopeptide (TPR) repeat protein
MTAAQRLNPNFAAIAYEQGQAFAMKNDAARSKDSFLQAARMDPKNYQVQAALASLMQAEGDFQSALSYAQAMLALSPNLPEGYYLTGSAYAAQQQYGPAITNFKHALQLAPGYSAASTGLGMVYVTQKQWKPAEDIFNAALKTNPSDASALAGLMAVYQNSGQTARILPYVLQQLAAAEAAHAPAGALAQLNAQLARAYALAKDNAKAETALQKSLQLDPHNYNTYAMLGTLYAQQNQNQKARDQYAKAAAQNPTSSGLWTMLGMLDESVNQKADAEQAYLKAVALDPNNGIASNNLAVIYSAQPDKIEQALVLAQHAKRALPTVAAINDTLGWIYVNQGVYNLAIPILQQAVQGDTAAANQTAEQKSEAATIRVHLATALYRSGQKQQARAQLQTAMQMSPAVGQQADVQQMLKN